MKLYIDGPQNGGCGIYSLLSEQGELLESRVCSNRFFALGDLIGNRPERQKEYGERFGHCKVLFLGEDDMTGEELVSRNKAFVAAEQAQELLEANNEH